MSKKMVFILLVYGNYGDLVKFIDSIPYNKSDYEVVVVDSFKNEEATNLGLDICKTQGFKFVSISNKGYGFGNDFGVKYALKNIDFKYLIIANPDTQIGKINIEDIDKNEIMGPKILNNKGANKNPHYYHKEKLGFYFLKKYTESKNDYFLTSYLIINKINKGFFKFIDNFLKKKKTEVYALHGSFFAMNKATAKLLYPFFNHNMFLYAEENHLAENAKLNKIKLVYNKEWIVHHYEDGSGESGKKFVEKNTLRSLTEFFNYWK